MVDADREAPLAEQIDKQTLEAYTRWKFPNLEVDEKLQGSLLSQLDRDHYKLIRDLDRVVDRAKGAVERWKASKQVLFQTGTDHIVKSLCVADYDFQAGLPFSRETHDGFLRYHHLVRVPIWFSSRPEIDEQRP